MLATKVVGAFRGGFFDGSSLNRGLVVTVPHTIGRTLFLCEEVEVVLWFRAFVKFHVSRVRAPLLFFFCFFS